MSSNPQYRRIQPRPATSSQSQVATQEEALVILQTVGDRTFETLAQTAEYLKQLTPEDRYYAISSQASKLIDVQKKTDQCMAYLLTFAREDEAISQRMIRDPGMWQKISDGAERRRKTKDKKQEAMTAVFERWGRENVERYFAHIMNNGGTTWAKIRRLALKTTLEIAMVELRKACLWRLTNPGPGRDNKTLEPVAADFELLHSQPEKIADVSTPISCGYAVGDSGWLVPAERVLNIADADDLAEEDDSSLSEIVSDTNVDNVEALTGANDDAEIQSAPQSEAEDVTDCSPSASDKGAARDTIPATCSAAESVTGDYEVQSDTDFDLNDGSDVDGDIDDSADLDYSPDQKKRKRDHHDEGGREKRRCGCASGIPNAFIARCTTGRAVNPAGQVSLIKGWAQHDRAGRSVCYHHARNIALVLGMQTRGIDMEMLKARLSMYYEAAVQNTIGKLKVDKSTYMWFSLDSRPSRPADGLGPYKLMPLKEEAFSITSEDQERLRTELGIDAQEWHAVGSIVLDCFEWWSIVTYSGPLEHLRGKTIKGVIDEEFDMYLAHLRKINNKNNYGWLRNMLHSLGQQVMRQDPLYYILYCALRPDRNTNLVSYPYYAKYARPGDSTAFRHIDLNIKQLAQSRRGASMIQGTVSLDNEEEDDCTIILPGMHHHIDEWARQIEDRGLSSDAFVHRISADHFNEDDAKAFGTSWTSQPCCAGQVRITLPHLPHGALGPTKRTRRTMLPWYVGLQADMETLEVAESGTWSDLSTAHRDLIAAPLSPSGLANRYDTIPFAFPAAVELNGLGAISDALVARRRHDKPAVISEKTIILKGTAEQRQQFIAVWRQKATNMVCEAFEMVKEVEMRLFGEKSFFVRKSLGLPPTVPDDDPDPGSPTADGYIHGFEEPTPDGLSKE
ncbi:uncharacterized protein Z518_04398 [Rhinocladiella mackenziei CBS 650.93]|uniref:Uncharacterized protein n=1 Tax=Rhinocladiella mackenziei CBS 650.93 TaxID=1442369 RepID=A0A0D2FW81_9EURO|nr:uncharacterized protein Z518_04398 [Rhinocladiella mackenziei CBS 650.93]KIX06422.1 hypothetical protein Z518_04398 [Rhinocladiella mackenziei CBS 650.93]